MPGGSCWQKSLLVFAERSEELEVQLAESREQKTAAKTAYVEKESMCRQLRQKLGAVQAASAASAAEHVELQACFRALALYCRICSRLLICIATSHHATKQDLFLSRLHAKVGTLRVPIRLIGICATSSQASRALWTRSAVALQGQNVILQAELAALQKEHIKQQGHTRQLTEAQEQLTS